MSEISGEHDRYPSGNEERDRVIELLCDEWPYEVDYREWDDRCALVVRLLDVLDANRLSIVDLGGPITTDELRVMAGNFQRCPWCITTENTLRRATGDEGLTASCMLHGGATVHSPGSGS